MNSLSSFRFGFLSFWSVLCLLIASVTAQEPTDYFRGNGSFEYGEMRNGRINLFSCNPHRDPNCPENGRRSSSNRLNGWQIFGSAHWADQSPQDGNGYLVLNAAGQKDTRRSVATYYGHDTSDRTLIHHTPFTIGDLYELSFWASGSTRPLNVLNVSLGMMGGGSKSMSFSLPEVFTPMDAFVPEWQRFSINFVATDETFNLRFAVTEQNLRPGERAAVLLDNVAITAVPEPSGAMLVCLGVAAHLAQRRRTAKSGA